MIRRLIFIIYVSSCSVVLINCKNNSDTQTKLTDEAGLEVDQVQSEEWFVLFDGTDFSAWKGYNTDKVSDSWSIIDQAMVFKPGKEGSHNIITKKKYKNFILSLEWRAAQGANSGIFWGVHQDEKYSQPYLTGPEIQILDNDNNPEGTAANGTHAAGSLFDMIACPPELVNQSGSWNSCVLEVNHMKNLAKVEMNGKFAYEFPLSGKAWDKLVKNSKFKTWEGFGKYPIGHIGLQDHGDEVWFRNIKIKELK